VVGVILEGAVPPAGLPPAWGAPHSSHSQGRRPGAGCGRRPWEGFPPLGRTLPRPCFPPSHEGGAGPWSSEWGSTTGRPWCTAGGGVASCEPGVGCPLPDIQNAFNTVDRSAMFQALRDRGFGDRIPFIRLFYGSPSDLLYTGVPQPQPSPLSVGAASGTLRALPLRDHVPRRADCRKLQHSQEAGGGRVLAFHDDAPIMGPVHALTPPSRPWCGKGSGGVTHSTPQEPSLPGLEHVTVPLSHRASPGRRGPCTLGCPLGTPEYCEAWRQQRLAESTACLAESGALEDPRTALRILRDRVLARPISRLRPLAPNPAWVRTLEAFDESIWRTVLQLMGFDTQDPSRALTQSTRLRLPSPGQAAASLSPSPLGAWAYHPWRP